MISQNYSQSKLTRRASFVFPKFFFPFQVLDSAMNPFHYTKYLFFPFIYCLFRILLTFHSFSLLIITRASCSFLCPSTCLTYFCILLILTTGYIFIVLGSSNFTVFDNMIFLSCKVLQTSLSIFLPSSQSFDISDP